MLKILPNGKNIYYSLENFMKKKRIIGGVLATAIAITATMPGCGLISTDSEKDMTQVIAKVDISKAENFESGLDAYTEVLESTDIVKRDLIAYFLNVGYSYIQSGMSYADTFVELVDALTDNAIVTQYSTMYILKNKAEKESKTADAVIDEFLSYDDEATRYEYLLGCTGYNATEKTWTTVSDDVNYARYSHYSSLNNSIDSYERELLDESDDDTAGTESRTAPTGIDTEVEEFYPTTAQGELDYGVYTGYAGYLLADSGDYQEDALDNTKRTTRMRAYNNFINILKANYLVTREENLMDVMSLNYVHDEYVSFLQQMVIQEYYDLYEATLDDEIKNVSSGNYAFLQNQYDELLNTQKSYEDKTAFESALGSMSDTSFMLYSPDTTDTDEDYAYGFVYNILLPFSKSQARALTVLSDQLSKEEISENEFYEARNLLLKNIKTTDQRSAWFNGVEDYSFDATAENVEFYNGGDANRKHLFFENNLTDTNNTRYESIKNYIGKYSYNGAVIEAEDDYVLIPNELSIDDMLDEFSAYVNYVLTGNVNGGKVRLNKTANYYGVQDFMDADDEVDYSNFVYATGSVNVGTFDKANLFNETTDQYKAMAAINELQYAYTTDTGVLSNYIGYNVSAYETSFIKEFEYATQQAIKNGAGSFAVCAGDYGWHLIYVTFAFDAIGGEVYDPDWTKIETEGTFEYNFYEWLKSSQLTNAINNRRTVLMQLYGGEKTVTLFEETYQDLLEIEG